MNKWVKKLRDALEEDLVSEKKPGKQNGNPNHSHKSNHTVKQSKKVSDTQLPDNFGTLGKLTRKTITELLETPLIHNLESELRGEINTPRKRRDNIKLNESLIERREDPYKKKHKLQYETMVFDTFRLYKKLSAGEQISYSTIKNQVESFFEVLIKDKNFLLNLSTARPSKPSNKTLYYHAVNNCLMSMSIPTSLGFTPDQIIEIGAAALLADVGMELVPIGVQFKKGKLTQDDLFEIQKHPIYSCNIMENIEDIPGNVVLGAYQHHEREIGTGYPKQRKSHLIHEYAQIISTVDVYEALTSIRPHRKAKDPYNAMCTVLDQTKHGFLNREKVKSFIEHFGLFPIGSLVKISNGSIAKVVASNKKDVSKPVVAVLTDQRNNLLEKEDVLFLDMLETQNEKIVSSISESDFETSLLTGF